MVNRVNRLAVQGSGMKLTNDPVAAAPRGNSGLMVAAVLSGSLTPGHRLRVALVTWLAMLGLDFLLNGALFARMYQRGGGFMLAPVEAFHRIPLGYLAFLILAFGVVELVYRLRVRRVADGVRLGLLIGTVLAATWSLGLYSIATLSVLVALAFAGIWLALIVLASGVAAAGLSRSSLRGLALRVGAFDGACVVIVISLQTLGLVPTMRL